MKTCKKLYHLSKAVAVISLFAVVLAGCGQWSGGAGTPSSTTISGVAAAGSPISGNASFKDSANHEIGPIPLGADGSFSFDVTGLTPPFYLFAVGNVGSISYKLYSVTTSSSGIANINPLTNVIVAAAAGGIDPASVYDNPSAHPVTNDDIHTAITGLQTMLASLLAQYDAEHIDPISDSFTADHTKLDKVFDIIAITVDSSGGGVPVVSVTDITGEVIAGGSTGNLEHPTTSLDPANIPKDVLSIGADRLVATQNNDGGWEWENPDTNPATGSSAYNTLGVTAQGLLDAYKINKNSAYLTACIKTYNQLVSNSKNSNISIHKIRSTDITFLVELSEVTGDSTYANFAKTRYLSALNEFGRGTATGFAEYVRDIRKGVWAAIISWDINLYIQGVLALDRYYSRQGFDKDAKSMAKVIYNSLYVPPVDFNFSNFNQNAYWLAYTGAIEAFTTTGLHSVEKNSLKLALIASQLTTGSMAGSFLDVTYSSGSPVTFPDAQATAYAVMALLKAGGNDANVAAKKGVKYLITNQSVNGGWVEDSGTTENTEVTGEAIHAIYYFKTPGSSTTAPEVISIIPANAATGIGVTNAVAATFSEAMDPSTITAANFTVTGPGGVPVLGGVTGVGNTATFTPIADLATSTVYTCTVTTGVKDLAGNAMADNFVWSFTTVPGVTVGPSGDYQTIQAAIDAVQPGDTIKVSAGTYNETINITKRVAIIGAGSGDTGTVLTRTAVTNPAPYPAQVDGVTYSYNPVLIISASGTAGNPILLKDIKICPRQDLIGAARQVPAILLRPGAPADNYIASYSYVELNNVRVIGTHSFGTPESGVRIDGSTSLYHFVVRNSEFSNMGYGMIFHNNAANPGMVQYVEVNDTTFNNNSIKGFYAEKLSDATFNNVTATNNGYVNLSPSWAIWNNAGIDITLLYGNYKNLVFNNLTVTGNGIGSYAGAGLTVKARGTGNDDPSLLATLDGVMVKGGTFTGNTIGIRFGEVANTGVNMYPDSLHNTSPTNITARGATVNTAGDIVNYLNGVTIHN